MRTITKEELDLILKEHKEWWKTKNDECVCGKPADLHGVDLSRADLYQANLCFANLSGAFLAYADLSYAQLYGADLTNATLNRADLQFADLSDANLTNASLYKANMHHTRLRNANLHYAELTDTDLSVANLSNAVLTGADLTGADLTGVDLTEASLYHANLYQADLTDANLDMPDLSNANLSGATLDSEEEIRFGVMLKEDMTGFKKCRIDCFADCSAEHPTDCIVELVIPRGSIVFSINNDKCRTNRAKVVSITNIENTKSYDKAYSYYDAGFVYEVGQEVEVEDFDCRYNVECGSGIHFFRKRVDAEQY